MRAIAVLMLCVGVVGCGAFGGDRPEQTETSGGMLAPKIISGNEVSVVLGNYFFSDEAGRLKIADEHCNKYGRSAQFTSIDKKKSRVFYNCVK